MIEYPSDFPIKVMGDNAPGFAQAVLHIVSRFDPGYDAVSSLVVWLAVCLATVILHNFLTALFIAVRMYRVVTALQFAWSGKCPSGGTIEMDSNSRFRTPRVTGGKDKGLEYGAFADAIAGRCRAVVLIGETADELERLIGERVPITRADDMDAAVAMAAAAARPGDVALLAPAAASFDMFVDYAARGDAFRRAVDRLGRDE